MLQRLLYTSQASEAVNLRDVYDIIRVSHNWNSRAGLTGGLLFLDGYFYQLIEGLPEAIAECYRRISSDPRHFDLVLRLKETIEEPLFDSDWMALRDGSQIDPSILAEHNYAIGLPADQFSGEQVFDLLVACFDRELAAIE